MFAKSILVVTLGISSPMWPVGTKADTAEWLENAYKPARSSPSRGKRLPRVRVASLDKTAAYAPPSLSGIAIRWQASAHCLNSTLRNVVGGLTGYGYIRVSSTCRSHTHNRRVGGAHRSLHLHGNAVDFRVFGNVRGVLAALRANPLIGGIKHYGGGLIHIDTGSRRSW